MLNQTNIVHYSNKVMPSTLKFCPGKCDPVVMNKTEKFELNHYNEGDSFLCEQNIYNRIIFILDGEISLTSIECHNFHLTKNHYAFLYYGYNYEVDVIQEATILIASFKIDDSNVCDTISQEEIICTISQKHRIFTMFEFTPLINNWIESLKIHLAEENMNCKLFTRIKMQELFIIFKFYCSKEEQLNMFHHMFDSKMNFRSLCDTYILTVHTVEDLAKICNMSVTSFKSKFRDTYKDTPLHYIQEQRKLEVERLISQNTPIKEIIQQLSFTDHSHFNRFCRKYLGCLPSKLKEK